jgi:hypothetical protein
MSGACNSSYIVIGNFCNLSCGRCNATEAVPSEGAAPADALSLPK